MSLRSRVLSHLRCLPVCGGEISEVDEIVDVVGGKLGETQTHRSSLVSTAARTSISSAPDELAGVLTGGPTPAQLLAQTLQRGLQQSVRGRRESDERFGDRSETVILLDFDDFLFATHEIRRRGLPWTEPLPDAHPMKPAFARLERILTKFLQTCHSLGNVAIVTLAKAPWVQMAMSNFVPETKRTVATLEIPVFYALDELRATDSMEGSEQIGTILKQRAMEQVLGQVYSKGKSWKNVLSMGDSIYEQRALQNVMRDYKIVTGNRKCRGKTVKLKEQPDIDTLVHQLTLLNDHIHKLVAFQYSCDIDVGGNNAHDVWLHWTRKLDGSNKMAS